MSKAIKLKVELLDGSDYSVPLTPVVQVAAERHFGCSFTQIVGEGGTMERTYWVAWKATHQAGHVVEPFDEWLANLSGLDVVDAPSVPLEAASPS